MGTFDKFLDTVYGIIKENPTYNQRHLCTNKRAKCSLLGNVISEHNRIIPVGMATQITLLTFESLSAYTTQTGVVGQLYRWTNS